MYVSLPSLHDYDVERPNSNLTFYEGREHKISSFELRYGLKNSSEVATLIYFLRTFLLPSSSCLHCGFLLNLKIWKCKFITASVALFVSSFVFFAATVLEQLQRQWL